MTEPVEDPGWAPAAKGLLFSFVPMLGASRAVREGNSLIVMRLLWCAFAGAMTLVGVVVIVLHLVGGFEASVDGTAVAVGVGVIGVFTQLFAGRLVGPLSGRAEAEVVAEFQRGFFLRVALAEVPALVGFVGFVLSANPLVYLLGLVIAAAGMADAAPTAARLDAAQQQLRATGSAVELLAALTRSGVTR